MIPLDATMPPPGGTALPATPAAIREQAEEFEAVFVGSMLQHMFSGLDTDGPFGGGQAEETYRSLLVEEMGRSVAAAGGIGIADEIARELMALQEIGTDDQ